MKTIIVDYEIGGTYHYSAKLKVTEDVFNSVIRIPRGEYNFANTIEIHRLKAYLRQLSWLDGTNRECRRIAITKIKELR